MIIIKNIIMITIIKIKAIMLRKRVVAIDIIVIIITIIIIFFKTSDHFYSQTK